MNINLIKDQIQNFSQSISLKNVPPFRQTLDTLQNLTKKQDQHFNDPLNNDDIIQIHEDEDKDYEVWDYSIQQQQQQQQNQEIKDTEPEELLEQSDSGVNKLTELLEEKEEQLYTLQKDNQQLLRKSQQMQEKYQTLQEKYKKIKEQKNNQISLLQEQHMQDAEIQKQNHIKQLEDKQQEFEAEKKEIETQCQENIERQENFLTDLQIENENQKKNYQNLQKQKNELEKQLQKIELQLKEKDEELLSQRKIIEILNPNQNPEEKIQDQIKNDQQQPILSSKNEEKSIENKKQESQQQKEQEEEFKSELNQSQNFDQQASLVIYSGQFSQKLVQEKFKNTHDNVKLDFKDLKDISSMNLLPPLSKQTSSQSKKKKNKKSKKLESQIQKSPEKQKQQQQQQFQSFIFVFDASEFNSTKKIQEQVLEIQNTVDIQNYKLIPCCGQDFEEENYSDLDSKSFKILFYQKSNQNNNNKENDDNENKEKLEEQYYFFNHKQEQLCPNDLQNYCIFS